MSIDRYAVNSASKDPRGSMVLISDHAAIVDQLRSALRAAMDDVPGWYDIARAAMSVSNPPTEGGKS